MKRASTSKELYQRLRSVPWPRLWAEEVPLFDQATPRERFESVSVIRAVGVVYSESGPAEHKTQVKQWLLGLLQDPEEKIRRYAMAALPKIGVGAVEESELLALLRKTTSTREGEFVGQVLSKIGGTDTLEAIETTGTLSPQTVQKLKASVARSQGASVVQLNRVVPNSGKMLIHLRGRSGLEGVMSDEVEAQGKFRVVSADWGLVAIAPIGPFRLSDVFALRCFGTMGFVLSLVEHTTEAESVARLAAAIASPASVRLLEALTEGPIRYRLDFIGKGHQRGAVRLVASRAFALCPQILNDSREAPWAIDIHGTKGGSSVELRPRLSPDPRHTYRVGDVPAASHPPLAACMARLAGRVDNESIWDPFCGSGLELIERTLLGGVRRVYGTDLSATAINIAERNFAAAGLGAVQTSFTCCDFREFPGEGGPAPQGLTLIISNPPLGKRVSIPNLRELFDDLFSAAARMLKPGGRLVLINPFHMDSPQPSLKLQTRHVVDLGGFNCRLEVYHKLST